jgi:hypothetical protein
MDVAKSGLHPGIRVRERRMELAGEIRRQREANASLARRYRQNAQPDHFDDCPRADFDLQNQQLLPIFAGGMMARRCGSG